MLNFSVWKLDYFYTGEPQPYGTAGGKIDDDNEDEKLFGGNAIQLHKHIHTDIIT